MRSPWVPIGLAIAAVAPAAFGVIGDPDTGWHLALGRLVAATGVPHVNALTWTATQSPWYDTSWLWDWLAFSTVQHLGLLGLQCLTLASVAIGLAALGLACDAEAPGRGAWLVPLTAILSATRVLPRPHLASWICLAAVLALCLRGQGRGPACRLACLPIIVVCANLHSGACFGGGVLVAFCLQALGEERRPIEGLIACLGVAALCANPGGAFDLRSMVYHLSVRDVVTIAEYRAPSPLREAYFYAEVPVVVWLAWRRRREQPAMLLVAVVFAALGLKAIRMLVELQWVAAPILARALFVDGALRWKRLPSLLLGAASLAAAATASYRWTLTKPWAPRWDEAILPVEAARFAREAGLHGRLFNAYRDGGFLEWELPDIPSFVDGRVQAFPPDFFPAFYAAEASPDDFRAYLLRWGAQWAIVPRGTPETLAGAHLLEGAAEWALVEWDAVREVFVRRDDPANASVVRDLEYRHFHPWGTIVGNVGRTPRAELGAYLDEVLRYERSSPSDPLAELVRCALAVRMSTSDAEATCAHADRLAPNENVKRLVGEARAVPPAP